MSLFSSNGNYFCNKMKHIWNPLCVHCIAQIDQLSQTRNRNWIGRMEFTHATIVQQVFMMDTVIALWKCQVSATTWSSLLLPIFMIYNGELNMIHFIPKD